MTNEAKRNEDTVEPLVRPLTDDECRQFTELFRFRMNSSPLVMDSFPRQQYRAWTHGSWYTFPTLEQAVRGILDDNKPNVKHEAEAERR